MTKWLTATAILLIGSICAITWEPARTLVAQEERFLESPLEGPRVDPAGDSFLYDPAIKPSPEIPVDANQPASSALSQFREPESTPRPGGVDSGTRGYAADAGYPGGSSYAGGGVLPPESDAYGRRVATKPMTKAGTAAAEGRYSDKREAVLQRLRTIRQALASGKGNRKKNETDLRKALDDYFRADMEHRVRDLDAISQRVQEMEQRLNRRLASREEVVELQFKLLVHQVDGLGFFAPGHDPGPQSDGQWISRGTDDFGRNPDARDARLRTRAVPADIDDRVPGFFGNFTDDSPTETPGRTETLRTPDRDPIDGVPGDSEIKGTEESAAPYDVGSRVQN